MSKYIKLEDAIEAVTSIFRVSALFSGINDNEDVWREKAEKVLAKCEVMTGTAKQWLEHIEVEDCISRSALISFIDAGHLRNPNEKCYSENDVVELIKNAPSVVPSAEQSSMVEEWESSIPLETEMAQVFRKVFGVDDDVPVVIKELKEGREGE